MLVGERGATEIQHHHLNISFISWGGGVSKLVSSADRHGIMHHDRDDGHRTPAPDDGTSALRAHQRCILDAFALGPGAMVPRNPRPERLIAGTPNTRTPGTPRLTERCFEVSTSPPRGTPPLPCAGYIGGAAGVGWRYRVRRR